jgi:hypothetical protein
MKFLILHTIGAALSIKLPAIGAALSMELPAFSAMFFAIFQVLLS